MRADPAVTKLFVRLRLQIVKCRGTRLTRLRHRSGGSSPHATDSSQLLPKHAKSRWRGFFCAWGRARTADPFLFREMLYQLSYPSKSHYSILFAYLFQLDSPLGDFALILFNLLTSTKRLIKVFHHVTIRNQ